MNVSSGAVRAAKRTFDAVEPPGGYYAFPWYGRANLAYTLHLAERLGSTEVSVFAADPGGAATAMTDGTMRVSTIVSPGLRLAWPLVRRMFARPTSGPASTAARPSDLAETEAALDGKTGLLIGPDLRPATPSRWSTDPRMVRDVLALSRQWAPLTAE